jgi:mannan polymerase II complex MNN11 subunit
MLIVANRWHGTILAKLAIVPQNLLNAYASGPASVHNGAFKEGDLVANFPGCDRDERSCKREQEEYFAILDARGKRA